jgi:hypothetical protein
VADGDAFLFGLGKDESQLKVSYEIINTNNQQSDFHRSDLAEYAGRWSRGKYV